MECEDTPSKTEMFESFLFVPMHDSSEEESFAHQVTFLDVPPHFKRNNDIIVQFTVTELFNFNKDDRIIMCENLGSIVASASVKTDFVTINDTKVFSAVFPGAILPKENNKHFVFCYLSLNMVVGISPPFEIQDDCLMQEYIEVEDPLDPGLIIFKSVDNRLQEDISQLKLDKAKLQALYEAQEDTISRLRLQLQELQHKLKKNERDYISFTHSRNMAEARDILTKTYESSANKLSDAENPENQSMPSTSEGESLDVKDYSTAPFKECLIAENLKTLFPGPKIEVQSCLSSVMKENDALSQELRETKEINASLRSRISVLELEVCSMNEKKHQLLMMCLSAYEQENISLKKKLEKIHKKECDIESLKAQVKSLTLENATLKNHFSSSSDCDCPFSLGLKHEIANLLLEQDTLKKQLVDLRKETVGKVSLHPYSDSSSSN